MGSGPTASLGPGRRCARHALATGPDGLCALCRSESLPPPSSSPTWVLGGVLGAILVVSGGAVAYRAATSFAHAAISEEPTRAQPATPSESEASASAPAAAPAEPPPNAAAVADAPPTLTGDSSPARGAEPAPAFPAQALPGAAAQPAQPPEAPPAAPTRPAPTQAELRAALSATPIVMYSASWCGVCRKARQFLSANGLRFQEIDADATPGAWDKIEQLSGGRGVPLIIVDGEQTPPGLSPSSIMRAASRSVERRLGVSGIQVKVN